MMLQRRLNPLLMQLYLILRTLLSVTFLRGRGLELTLLLLLVPTGKFSLPTALALLA
jgi:hypothetical protein